MSPSESLIKFENVLLAYGSRIILTQVNFEIQTGDFIGIVGPNGSGKTTLLKAMLGSLSPRMGEIDRQKEIHFGYVPQRNTIDPLFPLTSFDVVVMGLYKQVSPWQRISQKQKRAAQKALDDVGLTPQSKVLFSELSGGQQQRVLLARALVGKPEILILDEPTNGMDIASEAAVMNIVEEVHEQTGMTTVIVSHLLHVVAKHAKKVGLIKADSIEFGSTDELLTSKHLTELYGTPIVVSRVDGKTVVMTK